MKLKTPLDRKTIRDHLHYGLWKYALLVVIAIFAWDLIFAYTAYRPPQDKRIDIYIQSATTTQEQTEIFFGKIRLAAVPNMELVNTVLLMGNAQTDMFAAQQLTTYIMANEGDLYFLTGSDFKRFAGQGVFLELEDAIQDGYLDVHDVDLSGGYVAIQSYDDEKEVMVPISQQHLYGIPASSLFGFMTEMGIDNRDLYLCVTIYNQNDDNVLRFLNALIQATRAPKPDFLIDQGGQP